MGGNEILERRVQFSRLYDLYAPLLTERQRRVYELHEHDDLSFSEISEELGISRQGVSDQLTRGRERLEEIEKLLGFAASFDRIEAAARDIAGGKSVKKRAAEIVEICGGRAIKDV